MKEAEKRPVGASSNVSSQQKVQGEKPALTDRYRDSENDTRSVRKNREGRPLSEQTPPGTDRTGVRDVSEVPARDGKQEKKSARSDQRSSSATTSTASGGGKGSKPSSSAASPGTDKASSKSASSKSTSPKSTTSQSAPSGSAKGAKQQEAAPIPVYGTKASSSKGGTDSKPSAGQTQTKPAKDSGRSASAQPAKETKQETAPGQSAQKSSSGTPSQSGSGGSKTSAGTASSGPEAPSGKNDAPMSATGAAQTGSQPTQNSSTPPPKEEHTEYTGPTNPNLSIPLEKMKITNLDDKGKSLTVLYNPASYMQEKQIQYQAPTRLEQGAPLVQFAGGGAEILTFELFFDSISAGDEVGGTSSDRSAMAENKGRASADSSAVDVRDYTQKVYSLMYVLDKKHRPPKLRIEWASLQFECFLQSCKQNFTKFNESGKPVRARLQCQFIQHMDEDKLASGNPLESPDTTKYRTVRQGDSLWALAAAEYGNAGLWRVIADANRIDNPRELRPGTMLVLPALTKTENRQ